MNGASRCRLPVNLVLEFQRMSAEQTSTVEIPLTLRVSKQTQEKLLERAAASGTDLGGYVSAVVEQTARAPIALDQISGSVYQRFLASGSTDDELSDELEQAKHETRTQRRNRRAS